MHNSHASYASREITTDRFEPLDLLCGDRKGKECHESASRLLLSQPAEVLAIDDEGLQLCVSHYNVGATIECEPRTSLIHERRSNPEE